jgi:hypothetical protein
MNYDVVIFEELLQKFPTWDVLRPHLEQLHLRVIDCSDGYFIIRYEKGSSYFSNPCVPWFRSVLWDATTNRPLCIAPPRATDLTTNEVRIEEFLEGVMINVFLDRNGNVRYTTRSKLDATGTFYSSRSFQDLLMEALGSVDSRTLLGSHTFGSLLLQHPEHRIVSYIEKPMVHVIHTGTVDASGSVHFTEQRPALIKPVDQPLDQWFKSLAETKGWQWQGIVLKDGKGGRARMRSSTYAMVRTLRSDSPRLDLRFLKLRQKRMLETYFYYYPEDEEPMHRLEMSIRILTQQLYTAYVDCHIKHTSLFANLPPSLKTHVWSLHSLYLGSLKEKGHFIRKQETMQYINTLPIPRLLHLLKFMD